MRCKRGISPLIATVLVLGFTVSLAAVVMVWGTGFAQRMQTSTEEAAGKQVTCSQSVMFDLRDVTFKGSELATAITLFLENSGNVKIDGFSAKLYGSDSIQNVEITSGLNVGGLANLEANYNLPQTGLIQKVEVSPIINLGGEKVTCANNYVAQEIVYSSDLLASRNGGFELDFASWPFKSPEASILLASSEPLNVYEGGKSLKITSGRGGGWKYTEQDLTPSQGFEEGYTYFVKLKCKVEVSYNCGVLLGDDDNGQNPNRAYFKQANRAGTGSWENVYASVYAPPGSIGTTEDKFELIRIALNINTGRPNIPVYFDSVQLYKIRGM